MVLVLLIAGVFGGSLIAAILGTFLGNPLTYPLLWYAAYEAGNLMLGAPTTKRQIDLSGGIFQTSFDQLWPILKPMSLGCIPVGLVAAGIAYVLVKPMVAAYQHRRRPRP